MSDLIERAAAFAKERHADQKRKWTGAPYWHHCQAVAQLVASVVHTEEMVAAAWLHDVVEDTPTTSDEILERFGDTVGMLVLNLTDASRPQDGNRKARKAIDRERLAHAPVAAKTIKLADLIDNASSIVEHDKDFARVYLAEKEALLEVLGDGDPTLLALAYETLRAGQTVLVHAALEKAEQGIR
jgi:(p)ppGpp synthase/HD superfamily hydrolase